MDNILVQAKCGQLGPTITNNSSSSIAPNDTTDTETDEISVASNKSECCHTCAHRWAFELWIARSATNIRWVPHSILDINTLRS
jgi:hypothetical protein